MATSTFSTVGGQADARGTLTQPCSVASKWVAGRLGSHVTNAAVQDNSGTVTNPESHIADTVGIILSRDGWMGTNIVPRIKYIASAISTGVVIRCFGRKDSGDAWGTCKTRTGAITLTITPVVATDDTDGTYKYSIPYLLEDSWDCLAYNEFTFGIVTALAGTSVTAAQLQVRFL